MANDQKQLKITIYFRLNNGNGCSLTLPRSSKLTQLNSLLNDAQLQLPQTYRLVFKGNFIQDYSLTLNEAHIGQNSILHIENVKTDNTRASKIDVCIYLNGEKFIIKANIYEKISALKQQITKLTKISGRDQLLVFKGRKLKNENSLSFYKIGADSLICLHTTVKYDIKDDQILSDYSQIDNGFKLPECEQLLESARSHEEKKLSMSKTTLFRSESLNKKNLEELVPYEVEIHHRISNQDSFQQSKDFNFDLFKSMGMENSMKISMGLGLFESVKHPLMRCLHQQSADIYQQEKEESDYKQNKLNSSLVDSFISFDQI